MLQGNHPNITNLTIESYECTKKAQALRETDSEGTTSQRPHDNGHGHKASIPGKCTHANEAERGNPEVMTWT